MNKNLNTFTSMRNDRQLHLYLAWGCPFCHRILASLAITKLADNISITWMENIKGEVSWKMYFIEEPLFNSDSLKAVYQQLEPTVDHRYSVPLLVDKKTTFCFRQVPLKLSVMLQRALMMLSVSRKPQSGRFYE